MPSPREACPSCYLRQACPVGSLFDTARAPTITSFQTRKLASRTTVQRVGQLAQVLYVVRTGMLKSYTVTTNGSEHVRALHLPGELVGIDALARAQCTSFVESLETSTVCGIDGHEAWSLADAYPAFRRRLVGVLSQRIEHGENHACAVSKLPAERRVAALLGELTQRFARLGYARKGLELKLGRRDMANYLGLTVETVSRAMARLESARLIDSERARIVIRDPDRLAALEQGRTAPASSLQSVESDDRGPSASTG